MALIVEQGRTTITKPSLGIEWEVLGPFQIGTREAAWGVDPLETRGGFRSLTHDPNAIFPSALGQNGLIRWTNQRANEVVQEGTAVESTTTISFPNIEWDVLRRYYGWAAVQYQAWARTSFTVSGSLPQTLLVFADPILEFWINNTCVFGGDFYSYRRAPFITLLAPGQHRLDVRLIRDVRAFGGIGEPTLTFRIRLEAIRPGLSPAGPILLPEFIRGRGLASNLGSVPVHNTSENWVEVQSLRSLNDNVEVQLLSQVSCYIAPGQTRSIGFRLRADRDASANLPLSLAYGISGASTSQELLFNSTLHTRSLDEPHKYTFLHSDSHVSYAIVKTPAKEVEGRPAPILLNLHGAGLEADSEAVRNMLNSVEELSAFTIFPTGSTPWSGDDWHTWGWADVEAAVASLPSWAEAVSWTGVPLDLDNLYVVGHSNGGQGTWFALTHQPDRVKGAGPVAGYASIQAYVPYVFWHEMDPMIWKTLQTSLSSFKHELLVDNITNVVPIEQQHGGADDNVPTYHSRRLYELLSQVGGRSQYTEIPGAPHYYDGIMTTPALRRLYALIGAEPENEPAPTKFTTIYPNSGDMRSRAGILVDQLLSPDSLGRISGSTIASEDVWILTTSNIRRFHLSAQYFTGEFPQYLVVDGDKLNAHISDNNDRAWYIRDVSSKRWVLSIDSSWVCQEERFGAQVGALDAFLRTRGPISIKCLDSSSLSLSVQMAQNLYQYFFADCNVSDEIRLVPENSGNRAILGSGHDIPSVPEWFPIQVTKRGILITDSAGACHEYPPDDSLGAIFVSPLENEKLQLNIWGCDAEGLFRASRLVPLQTGVGQPDFVVVSKSCAYKGAAGVLASGFFDFEWRVSKGSFLG